LPSPPTPTFWHDVWALVRTIPPGRVTSYGTVGAMLGSPRLARAVGWALHALPPGTDVPWQRVINARGRISFRGDDIRGMEQELRLRAEGVEFGPDGAVDWSRFGWPARGGD